MTTLNLVGIRPRSRDRKTTLGALLAKRSAEACLSSEAHSYDFEVPKLTTAGFEYADHQRRGKSARQKCGGLAIFEEAGLHFGTLNALPRPLLPLTICSVLLCLRGPVVEAIGAMAVQFPPSVKVKKSMEKMLMPGEPDVKIGGAEINLVLAGYFNLTSWPEGYADWISNHGIRELADPEIPTFKSGNSPGKILLVPGPGRPLAIPPPAEDEDEKEAGGEHGGAIGAKRFRYFPEATESTTVFADRRPAFSDFPCGKEPGAPRN